MEETEIELKTENEEKSPNSTSTKLLLARMTTSRRLERFLSATDRAPSMNLEFTDIIAQVPAIPGSKIMKTILKSVKGAVHAGEFLALMGPSGAGKSTLLNVLGTRFDGEYSGQVFINGEKRSKKFKKHIGYVLQNDILLPNLTVRETLDVTAKIRLPSWMSEEKKKERVDDVIHILGLSKCENTLVQRVSGGEKKRVSVGNEMLINPSVLFLDEPTSGLDSTSAFNMLMTLKELCRQGRTVICAIHQPSSQMFAKFDKLLLLGWGHVIYHGKAGDAVTYFSKVGYPCPMHFNPADFVLELITDSFQSENEMLQDKGQIKQNLIKAWKERGEELVAEDEDIAKEKEKEKEKEKNENMNGHETVTTAADESNEARKQIVKENGEKPQMKTNVKSVSVGMSTNDEKEREEQRWPTSWFTQFHVLAFRAYRHRRGNILTPIRIFEICSIAILAGLIYFRLKKVESNIVDFMGASFFIQIFITFMTMFRGVMYFPMERQVIRKERQSGAYRLTSYYCAKIIAEFPVDSTLPLLGVTIYYWLVGMGDNVATYILYMLSTCLTVWVASSFGTMVGCSLMEFERAITALSVTGIFFMLLGGFYVKTKSIPVWISWIGYISHFRWAVTSTENITMRHIFFKCATGGASSYTFCNEQSSKHISGLDVLEAYGTDTRPWIGPIMMLVLSMCWHFIAFFWLRRNTAVRHALGENKTLQIIEDAPAKTLDDTQQ